MRRSLTRACAVVLAALALPVLAAGPVAAAKKPATTTTVKLQSTSLSGDGSTFQKGFNDVAIGYFKQLQKGVSISYQATGSGQGRTDFMNKVVDFAGTDAPYPASGPAPTDPFLYIPTVVAPITVSYNVSGVSGLKLSADTIAKIFQAQITTWNDPAIKADNPSAKLPSTKITVVHRSDGSGTTQNFTEFLVKAAPTTWTLGSASTVQWPASTQGASGNGGVAQLVSTTDGAVGYVDFSDAVAGNLTYAAIKNSSGKFITPSTKSAAVAVAGVTPNPDLTYDPINASGAAAYPITSPTWIMVYKTQGDAKKGAAIKAFLNFVLGTGTNQGQKLAATVDYAALPKTLLGKAKTAVNSIIVPA
ncbi:MAG TPA: phosphate ABC transporter substrate-binding protein PstS [Acidimicrobiia bacterium]|nr:phosphate ABC transporter substrate-binding protein PstS [Acidimicrobiia bacterium]